MKSVLLTLFILFQLSTLFGQKNSKPEPFIIKGQLRDRPEKFLLLSFTGDDGLPGLDTFHLDSSGNFYLKTFKVKKPQVASILYNSNYFLTDLYVAPGYNLTISGSAQDYVSLLKSKKIEGKGAESSRYRFLTDSIIYMRMYNVSWMDLTESELLAHIQEGKRISDSTATVVFKKATRDKYQDHFRQIITYNKLFEHLTTLIAHTNWHKYDRERSIRFLRNNFDTLILDNLYQEKYMIADSYKSLMGEPYITFLVRLDVSKDSTLDKRKNYDLEKINADYKGKIKEYAIQSRIKNSIFFCKSQDELTALKKQYEPFIAALSNKGYQKMLATKFSEKEEDFSRVQVGKPAPTFTLQSNAGSTHSLSDYKGKVVYLDLWASWCGPCREETPGFKALYDKYKSDDRIVFLSIAVHDNINNWKKAIAEDQPTWTQLLDKEGIVSTAYMAMEIPRFILINKQGIIVNADAPRPSSGNDIEQLLNQELAQ